VLAVVDTELSLGSRARTGASMSAQHFLHASRLSLAIVVVLEVTIFAVDHKSSNLRLTLCQ
jgi:hypothetical protein